MAKMPPSRGRKGCYGKACVRACAGRRTAFTLVELLVVIAIVMLLISILTPSMLHSRVATRLMKCKGRMHQLIQGNRQYASAHRGYKAPMIARDGDRTWYNWSSTMTKVYGKPTAHGTLVALRFIDYTLVLCPALVMLDDSARDRQMWEKKDNAGSSDVYFWRSPDGVDLSAASNPDEKEAILTSGATFVAAGAQGRGALIMDFNAQGTSRYNGVYNGPRWASHPLVGRINVAYIDGDVRDFDNEKLWLAEPGTMAEELQWWEKAHAAR